MTSDPRIRRLLETRLAGAYQVPDSETRYTIRQPLPPGVLGIAAAMPTEDWHAITYTTPTRSAAVQADVLVPVLQSIISGALAGLVVLVAGLALRTPAGAALAAAGAAAVVVAAFAWMRLLRATRDALTARETITRRDDGPQVIEAQADRLRVEVIERAPTGAQSWTLADLPASREVLTRICRNVAGGGMQLSGRDLARLPGLSRDRARELLAAFYDHGLTHYPNGRNDPAGAQWTARGRALSRTLRESWWWWWWVGGRCMARSRPRPPRGGGVHTR